MSFNVEYLKRNLTRRVQDEYSHIVRDVEGMMALHASKGMLGSGATLRRFEEIAVEGLKRWYADAAIFVFSLTDQHDPLTAEYLGTAARDLVAAICIFTRERGRNTGLQPDAVEKQAARIKALLGQISDEQLDDFTHGILGNTKMKKDPLVTLTANQTNSPGAIQQVGLGSQQSAIVNYQNLINAIDSIVRSSEYASLSNEQKVAFDDIADFIGNEAAKPAPDVSRLTRWGKKLLQLTEDLAMNVATSTLATALSKLIVG